MAAVTAPVGGIRAAEPGATTSGRPRTPADATLPQAHHATRYRNGAGNPVQRDAHRTCADCGAPVRRARRARGPLPLRCPACVAIRRPRAQLRAYLRSAARLADAEGLPTVHEAVLAALAVFDAAEVPGKAGRLDG